MEGLSVRIDGDSEEPVPITAQEEKELRRVFDLLCNYHERTALYAEVREMEERLEKIRSVEEPEVDYTIIHDRSQLEVGVEGIESDIRDRRRRIERLERNPDRKIGVDDLTEMLRRLGSRPPRKDVEEMVWQVDENLDGEVDMDEFRLMFQRNITDKSGLEMSKLYNLVQFLIYDHNMNGYVSVDETMNMLYARYGRSRMENKLRELFGEDMHETGKEGGEITYAQYLDAVERIQMHTFFVSTDGRRLAPNKKTALMSVTSRSALSATAPTVSCTSPS